MKTSVLNVAMRLPLWAAGLAITGSAHSATKSTLDLSAGVGISTNPQLQIGGRSSAFGRISALGTHEWRSERTTMSISLFGENSTYLKGYGSQQIFDLNARWLHQVSPNVSIFGNVGFQGDAGGQLSNRFASTTPDLTPVPDNQPLPPVVLDDPSLTGFGGRQYRLSGIAGVSIRASARSSVSVSAGAQRSFATGFLRIGNYNSYFGNASYDYQFSERMSAGLGVSVQYQDYDNGRSSSVINPVVTARHQFSDQVSGTGSVGVLLTRQSQLGGGSSNSVNPSFALGLCRATQRDRLCGRVSRDARTSFGLGALGGGGSLATTTTAGVDYSRQLNANESIQMSFSASRYSTRISGINDLRTTYLTFLTGYDRKIGQRLAVGANVGARHAMFDGRDPKTDYSGSIYLRYRVGDLR